MVKQVRISLVIQEIRQKNRQQHLLVDFEIISSYELANLWGTGHMVITLAVEIGF